MASKFTFEVGGRWLPFAYPVMYPVAQGSVTVRLTTTEATPDDGTPAVPVTFTARVEPPDTMALLAPWPSRVSSTRVGTTAPKPPTVASRP